MTTRTPPASTAVSPRAPIIVGTISLVVGVLMAMGAAWMLADRLSQSMALDGDEVVSARADLPSTGPDAPALRFEAPKAQLMRLIVDGTMGPPIATDWIVPLWGGLALALIALGIGQVRTRRWARTLTPWWALAMLASVAAAVVVARLNADLRGESGAEVWPRLAPMFILAVHPLVLCVVATRRGWRAAFD